MKVACIVCWSFVVLTTQFGVCKAGFGDYADHSFKCPATTTCPVVCVASYEECPEQLRCPETEQLCADGSCAVFCSPNLVSPCEQDCALVACPQIVASFDYCMSEFAPWYEAECSDESTGGEESDEYDPSWFDPGFMLVYLWVITNTVGIVAFSWYKYVFACLRLVLHKVLLI